MMEKEIVLVGGGGHCSSVIDVIEEQGAYKIAGIIDKDRKIGEKVLGYDVIGDDQLISKLTKKYQYFHVSLGFIRISARRSELFQELLQLGACMPSIVSPLAFISRHATIGIGSIIMHHAQVNASAFVGDNCIINSKALLEHDCVLGANCHVSTGAIINGNVKIGDSCFIGSGAVIVQGVTIAPGSFIRANSLCTG
jgi:sugar O-acyltransferase (sialic acid O-acetyltransferase NeuD family)